ncbi:preprotein translocase subunit YajC [Parabacteroides sp. PFB2-12]|uniref:NVEALA domain-containing protein n=1 Tax=unclassified Parabacteroides TaxID=2649774 RepID=UPI00247501D3|nr:MULTISPECIES: NVEALA domain-containing protein [unclassified Parabacteroides]MDH6344094.1 preprotein translocase subunit YajC [Parabacteroides sp. PM6-13]MDH6391541.1 preprotein translocase subunit YajC [Parabacteroides sp. PFB2-12]
MNKKVMLLLAVCFLFSLFYFYQKQNKKESDLFLSNVEALAQGEEMIHVICYGRGTIDCRGEKYEIKIENYRLK